jgi:predicted NBD/HSP70 family sugar kinase
MAYCSLQLLEQRVPLMANTFRLVQPRLVPPLDDGFRPAALANRAYLAEVAASGGGVPLVFGLERPGGAFSRFETRVFAPDHPRAAASRYYAERMVKFLLWQRGGSRVIIGGPEDVGQYIQQRYAPTGARAFDQQLMSEKVYQTPFSVVLTTAEEVPPEHEAERTLGRHLDGCRIGLDLGASDLKVAAVVDGEAIYTEEIVWEPQKQKDPEAHYRALMAAIRKAAGKMPRLDAIGVSSAGIYVNNRPMVASLFRGVPDEHFEDVRNLFLRIRDEMGVPLEAINDGDVAALAGSMSLGDGGVLGIALGSSQAGGYVTTAGKILDWLHELSFCPVDYSPDAPSDEWSGDRGCGALYFSQQCVFRLAPKAGIEIPAGVTNAEKLESVQRDLEAGHAGAVKIWETMGIYMGYAIAHYASFYRIKHVLLLGRCTSGRGGPLIVAGAKRVLAAEFPETAAQLDIQLPDEKYRRVGQSIAAASLPALG